MKDFSLYDPCILEPSVVISASAGSGKTFTLTVLVLAALGSGDVRPHEILAATFSEAASADLRERLLRPLDSLNSIGLDTWGRILPIGPDIGEKLGKLNVFSGEITEAFKYFGSRENTGWMGSPSSAKAFWKRTRREAELMRVSTLHALALGLLRTGGGAPDRIMDANHPALLRLLRRAMREVAEVEENSPDFFPSDELAAWAEYNWQNISAGHDAHRDALGDDSIGSSETIQDGLLPALEAAITEMAPFAADPMTALNPASKTKRFFDPNKILPIPRESATLSEKIIWAQRQSAALDFWEGGAPTYYAPDFVKAVQTFSPVATLYEAWLGLILKKTLARFEDLKEKRGMATFGDMVRSAINGLENHSIAAPKPKLLLIDEYQDTSIAQDAFLGLLEADRIVRVGDIKQAIYGFRGGSPELLKKHIETAGDSSFRLPDNFRSAPPIVDLANDYVSNVWPSIDDSMSGIDGCQSPRAKGDCPVCAVLTTGPALGTNLPALSDWIGALAQESGWQSAVGDTGPADKERRRALLIRQRTKLPELLLRLKEKGINPYVLAVEGFWDSPGPRLMMAALEAMAHPSRPLPCAAILRHIAGLTDFELNQMGRIRGLGGLNMEKAPREKLHLIEWLQSLRSASAQQIAASILAQGNLLAIISSLDAHGAAEPERARRNLSAFMTMLQDQPECPSAAFAFLNELKEGAPKGDVPSPGQNADLTIQTVHGSKGLEYDDVILPLLNNPKSPIKRGRMLTCPNSKSLLFAWKLGAQPGENYQIISSLIDIQQRRDDMNLFYVALTRAKKRLCLLIQSPNKKTPEKATANAQHYPWQRLGLGLIESHQKIVEISQLPPTPVNSLPQRTKIQMCESAAARLPSLPAPHDSQPHFATQDLAENMRYRSEGIEMHAYLQNLLVRWEDSDAFSKILNSPPPLQDAKQNALRFLSDFESKGLRHARRRTEMNIEGEVKGRADLVVWDNECIHIIDFKNIFKLTPESRVEYSQQLSRYAKALLPQGMPIKCWLVLLKSGEWVEMPI
ncbi:MAG: UvrD-helicase domain-containing protein [Holophagales bacterium]|jgi:ATP-dependent exoDNAse (exonuclease V) beta subunit|nr:UvrD-helicase domain-containing protein [Holophagales bacterium]